MSADDFKTDLTRNPLEAHEAPVIMLHGQHVALGPLRRDIQPAIVHWFNDLEVLETFSSTLTPLTLEGAYDIYDRISRSEKDIVFSAHELSSLHPIGYAGLYGVSHAHGTAELTIVIGDKTRWGKGYGSEIANLLLGYAFDTLGLHNVMARVYAYNERSLRLAKRAGFREIGRRREAHRHRGKRHDLVFLDFLASDWKAPKAS